MGVHGAKILRYKYCFVAITFAFFAMTMTASELALATLSDALQIGSMVFVLHHLG